MPDPIRTFIVTPHASEQMKRRGIDETTLESVLVSPERRLRGHLLCDHLGGMLTKFR